jgi:glycine betaine/proline transport system substrate-binding protein
MLRFMNASPRVPCRWLAVIALAVAVAACGGSDDQPAASKPTIKLAENPWSGSMVDAAVAAVLLREQMGFPVEITAIDENAQWAMIGSGALDACLEVWPSGHATHIDDFIEKQRLVEDGGALGPVGKIGWYVPTYLVDQYPELATFEGFKDPGNVARFRTAETGDKGRFLAGDPSWVQYDQQIIQNLGLDFDVVFAGSEQALLAQVDAAYQNQQPILFYFWVPHSAHRKYDLTEVQLPTYSAACYAKADAGGVDCDYPTDVLFKIFWRGLQGHAPQAYQFLKNFHYSTADQTELIAMVDLDGKTPETAARAWVAQHESIWKPWIPAGS